MYKKNFLSMCVTAALYAGTQPRWERDLDDAIFQLYWTSPKKA